MKPRQCPHCGICANPDSGYYFDEDLNMRCVNCEKVMYPTRSSDEHGIGKRDTWRRNWDKDDKKPPTPHRRIPKNETSVVYRRPSSSNNVMGFVPEQQLFTEPADKLRIEAEIESGL